VSAVGNDGYAFAEMLLGVCEAVSEAEQPDA